MPLTAPRPELIVRPTGVWDTRAPRFQFIAFHRRENQLYYALLLAVARLLNEAREAEPSGAGRKFFAVKQAGAMVGRAWAAFMNSFPAGRDGQRSQPTVKIAADGLLARIPSVTEYAIRWTQVAISRHLHQRDNCSEAKAF